MECRLWQKKKKNNNCFFSFIAIYIFFPSLRFQSFCEHGWNSLPPTAPCISHEAVSQLVRAIMATAELHYLRDNAWLTWSTSEPDILLSLHHNTTTQTDMAGPLISRAGLTDLLCAHCNGCMVSSNMPRLQWLLQNINIKFCALVQKFYNKYQTVFNDFWIVSVAFLHMNISFLLYSKRYWNLNHGWGW